MGFFDFLKPKQKSEIEVLAHNCIKKVENGTETEVKKAFEEMTRKIKLTPAMIKDAEDYYIVGKALFIIQFMGIDSSTLSKSTLVNLAYFCLSKSIQMGKNETDSVKILLHLILQSHSNLEGSIRQAISIHNPTTEKEVKESLTKIMYYIMKSWPYTASGNQQAFLIKSSLDSMINTGRLGVHSTKSSVCAEGQKYFNWLREYIEEGIDNGDMVMI